MNETIDMLLARRSVAPHLMSGPAPGAGEIDTMLRVAARVPDHGKLAPWRFIVIEGEARARAGDAIAAFFSADQPGAPPERLETERGRLLRAPLVVAVVSRAGPHVKIPEWEQVMSAGAVCMNLIVAANALGFVTAWLTEWYAYDRRVLDWFGLAPHETMAGFVHVGRNADPQADRVRPDMAAIVSRA